ncbi:MAG: DUF2911 domain-containing protein [Cyclobacteriaceae bacterium]|nr:DUF2911 domain-containing protein [Cyclobacteriaceae bacterium]
MKRTLYLSVALLLLGVVTVIAQDNKAKRPSPPAVAEATIDGVKVRIDYSQPSARGRKMLGGNEPFGKVWRTGANETTTIDISGDIKVEGKALAKGKYGLFTIPGEKEWVIIINKEIAWGAYSYNEKGDVLRVTVPAGKTDKFVETFEISIVGKEVVLQWENTRVAFKLQ